MLKINIPKKFFKALIFFAIPAFVILTSYFRVFETFELATLDLRFKVRPAQQMTDKVVFIEIAEDTLAQLGEWPISRDFYAALIDVLTLYDAKAIVFDILFGQESSSDALLDESIKKSNKVYLPEALRLSYKEHKGIFMEAEGFDSEPLGFLREGARGVGHINAVSDIDGKRRRAPLFLDYKGNLIPHIAFMAACDYLEIPMKDVKVERGRINAGPDLKIPVDPKGLTIINYAGRWDKAFRHYSFVDILKSYVAVTKGQKPAMDLSELRGKICLVGLTAVATHDLNPIPLQERYPMVGLHANLINMILTKNFIVRTSRYVNIAILVFIALIVLLGVLRLRPAYGIVVALSVFFGLIAAAFALFGFLNIWIDLFYPLILAAGVYIVCTFYKYISEQQKRMLMQRELDIAQRIQKSFLKEAAPQKSGLEAAVLMTPAKTVGGDLYDFVDMRENRLGMMVGDVSGKGVPAALFMAMTVSDFRYHSRTLDDPLKVVTSLNNQISAESTSGLFVTLCYMVADMAARKLTIADAGHLPVIWAGKNKETKLITATGGMALGIMEGVEFKTTDVPIEPGDVFVLYTDGVTEARNPRKEEFGEERLKDLVSKYKDLSAQDITKKTYETLLHFRSKAPQHDDITIMVLRID